MTEDEKYEIATLASDYSRKFSIFQMHQMTDTPTDLLERERAMAAYCIAQTEYLEAAAALHRAQLRIAAKT
jgi:hypothetical protein